MCGCCWLKVVVEIVGLKVPGGGCVSLIPCLILRSGVKLLIRNTHTYAYSVANTHVQMNTSSCQRLIYIHMLSCGILCKVWKYPRKVFAPQHRYTMHLKTCLITLQIRYLNRRWVFLVCCLFIDSVLSSSLMRLLSLTQAQSNTTKIVNLMYVTLTPLRLFIWLQCFTGLVAATLTKAGSR